MVNHNESARGLPADRIGPLGRAFFVGAVLAGSLATVFVFTVMSTSFAGGSGAISPGIVSWIWDAYRALIEMILGMKRGGCQGMYHGLMIGILTPPAWAVLGGAAGACIRGMWSSAAWLR